MERKSEEKARHVLVSGGSKGLGFGMVVALLGEGYRVSTFSRSASEAIEDLARRHPGSLYFDRGDLGDPGSLAAFVKGAVQRFGPIYGLVNNAAVAQEGVLATLPELEVHRMIAINLEGTIILTRHCIREMLKVRDGGRIINISSIIGTRGYNGLAVYSATKAALDGLSRSLSRELGRRQIAVNSIAPGYMRTDMSMGLDDSKIGQITNRTPMGRLAEIGDVTPLVSFLLSNAAAFITGQTILVDGGISS